jgi:hypothetical protein
MIVPDPEPWGVGLLRPLSAREYRVARRALEPVSAALERFRDSPDTSGLWALEELKDALIDAMADYEANAHGLRGRLLWCWGRFRCRRYTLGLRRVFADYDLELSELLDEDYDLELETSAKRRKTF